MTHRVRAIVKYVRRNPGVVVLVVAVVVALVLALREPGKEGYTDQQGRNMVRGYCKKKGRTVEKALSKSKYTDEFWEDDIRKWCEEGIAQRNFGTNDTDLPDNRYKQVVKRCRRIFWNDLEDTVNDLANEYNMTTTEERAKIRKACTNGMQVAKTKNDSRNWSEQDYATKCKAGETNYVDKEGKGVMCGLTSLRRTYPCQGKKDDNLNNPWGRCCFANGSGCGEQAAGKFTIAQDIKDSETNYGKSKSKPSYVDGTQAGGLKNLRKQASGTRKQDSNDILDCEYYGQSKKSDGKWECDKNKGLVDTNWKNWKDNNEWNTKFKNFRCTTDGNCVKWMNERMAEKDGKPQGP